ncbi:hypothetical protein VDG1235_1354 [Verrucomicrobiia bacterium DG1235]|nr:hypothetical protein VDG1235_1354 [Verrucomicrobiae bacterium DG1235]
MKYFRFPNIIACSLLAIAFFAAATPATAADSVRIKATLILGTNDGGGVDGSLRQYEKNLKRVLPFDTFKSQGSGSANVSLPGSSRIGIGGGQTVNVDVQSTGDSKYRIAARWSKGGQTYINTTVVASKNRPTVLVGPSSGGGKLILLLVAN